MGLFAAAPWATVGAGVIHAERTYFGVHYVLRDALDTRRMLRHGTTLHGVQIRTDFEQAPGAPTLDAAGRDRLLFGEGEEAVPFEERVRWLHLVPTAYFHPSGPAGDVMREMRRSGRFERFGLVGLGAGTMLAYAAPGCTISVYEIDPAVVRIAREPGYFTYASEALRLPGVAIEAPARAGDGRLDLARVPDGTFDVLVIDAFSSDAIPTHLLTLEAVREYRRVLKPGGVLAMHVSSVYFRLPPVVGRIARELGLEARGKLDALVTPEQAREAKRASSWVVLARDAASLGSLDESRGWRTLGGGADDPLWTDEHSNPLGVMVGWRVPVGR
jgi:SAM-dependent methyltransferase